MKTTVHSRPPRGYVSYVMVLSVAILLTLLMTYAWRNSARVLDIQRDIQVRADFINKEDAFLRSVVAIVPNRAIRCMQSGSETNSTTTTPLLWGTIFSDALDQANARNSISTSVATNLNLSTTFKGNSGDSTLTNITAMVDPIQADDTYTFSGISTTLTRYVASGMNHTLGTGFPPPLNTDDTGPGTGSDISTQMGDIFYPIISTKKYYGALASGNAGVALAVASYPQFNKIKYPKINFGYALPGDWFVAKRNWWAFSVNLYQNDFGTRIDQERDYVLSIYEIPSQLAVSANAFTALGAYGSGEQWQNVSITGRVFAGKAQVEGSTTLGNLAARRSMTLSSGSTIGGTSFAGSNPFTPGLREQYEITNNTTGDSYPVSLPSESGRAVFVPINRGTDFFDRYALSAEANTLSRTTWNNYSVGALQCAMKLDVADVTSTTNQMPVTLRFTYKKAGADVVKTLTVNSSAFDSATPPVPFNVLLLPGSKPCVVIKPQRFAAYLTSLGADSTAVNNSISVNADYTQTRVRKPALPCLDTDIGVVLNECSDLTSFTKGFSLVTNMRLYIGDDYNIVATTPPTGSGLPSPFYPPSSLYAPERRYGTDVDPWKVQLSGQVGSLGADDLTTPLRPLDMKTGTGATMAAANMTVNLSPITHPAALPPITMMNWLIVLEERRKEFY